MQICRVLLVFFTIFSKVLGIDLNLDVSTLAESYEDWQILTNNSQSKSWPDLSKNRASGIRTQRDISANLSVTSNLVSGINLDTVLFDTFGYNETSLDKFRTLLNIGIQTFVLDIYYDEISKRWLLFSNELLEQRWQDQCNNANFNFSSIVNVLNDFLIATNNDLNINTIHLLFRLKPFGSYQTKFNYSNATIPNYLTSSNITTLSSITNQINKVITPSSVNSFDLPTLSDLLMKQKLRVFPVIIENNLPLNSTYSLLSDNQSIFTAIANKNRIDTLISTGSESYASTNSLPLIIDNFQHLNCRNYENSTAVDDLFFHFSYDSDEVPFTNQTYYDAVKCGYSPIINHTIPVLENISPFLELSLWSWAPYQPTSTNVDELNLASVITSSNDRGLTFNSNGTLARNIRSVKSAGNTHDFDTSQDEFLNRCSVLTQIGIVATSCDRKFYSLCRNTLNFSDVVLTPSEQNSLKSPLACENLGNIINNNQKYELAIPRSSLELQYFLKFLPADQEGAWINLNSLSTKYCWVVGLNSNCPYQKVISRHIFTQMITPSSVMAFLLFVLLIFFQFQRLHVHKNKKYWRKVINEKLKNDKDGVPS